jgi:hypothetical protein
VNHTNLVNKNINEIKWKYFLNLASTEFPLRSNYEMTQILKLYNGANDIEGNFHNIQYHRFKYIHKISNKNILLRTNELKETIPHNFTIAKGLAYGAFSRAFVDFILNNKYSQDLINWSRDTYSPDEM